MTPLSRGDGGERVHVCIVGVLMRGQDADQFKVELLAGFQGGREEGKNKQGLDVYWTCFS